MYVTYSKKSGKNKIISMFHQKRIILMRKRRKLIKSHKSDGDKNAQILHLEELICDSHTQEKLHDEEIVVTKIKTDPNYFFRYAKKHSLCLNEIGPLMGPNKTLTSDKYEMCCSLLYQFNSVLQSHIQKRLLQTPFFSMQPSMSNTTDLYLTDIALSEKNIIDAIQELSPTSVAGPDGLPSSLLVNCATELAPILLIIFTHSLSSGVVPPSFK